MAEVVYTGMAKADSSFSRCTPYINYPALFGVLLRYSRDIYGFRRISAKLENLERVVGSTANLKEEIENIISEGPDFGFLIPSSCPYIHRAASVLLYWFSVLKPFCLNVTSSSEAMPDKYIIAYFNEYFAYALVNTALHPKSVELTVHESEVFFRDEFLNQLHYRNLSRSSLEFFLPKWVRDIV